jgi:hypothetical protein
VRPRSTRTELAAVALALLLPIPLFVASGLRLPLPGAVERALASLGSDAVFGPAEVEARPGEARSDRGTPDSVAGSAPTDRRQATSSTALIVGTGGAPSAGDGGRQSPRGGSTPDAGADTPAPPGHDPEREPIPDAPAPPRQTPTAPVDAETTTAVDTGADRLELEVTDDGVEVVVAGKSVDVPVPVPVPVPDVPAPAAPVPLPPLQLP